MTSYEKIEAIIKPFKLDEVKEALHDAGIPGTHRFWRLKQGSGQAERPSGELLSRRRICGRLPAQR